MNSLSELERYLVATLLLGVGGVPAAAGLWTLLRHQYMWGGRSLSKSEKVRISPREKPFLFFGIVLIHAAVLSLSVFLVLILMRN